MNIEQLKMEIVDVENRIRELESEIYSLKSRRHELDGQIATIDLLDSIKMVNGENSMSVRLWKDTKTTPIMSEFCASSKRFLVFNRCFSTITRDISLVVTVANSRVKHKGTRFNMTNLKELSNTYVTEKSIDYVAEDERRYPLIQELSKICRMSFKKGDHISFEIPCLLGGQTYMDQTGFGSEYCGNSLVSKGKEYGETTKFFIIGVIVE